MSKFFPILFLFCFHVLAVEPAQFSIQLNGPPDNFYAESLLKNMPLRADLTHRCKSDWSAQGCSAGEKAALLNYVAHLCGDMPEGAHHISKQYFAHYITTPMRNTAFLNSWSWLNSSLAWPVCVVCSLGYLNDPRWEENLSICENF